MATEIDAPEVTAATTIGDGDRIELLDHGFVRLDASMADDLSVANAARVSFARRKEELDDADRGLIRFLMRDRHGTPFEHNSFRFHIRCPIFVAREWMRHRIGCLTGDTVVTFVNTNGHATPGLAKTVDELWAAWTGGERDGHALDDGTAERIRRDGRWRIRGMNLRVLDESTNEFTVGHIEDVVDKGVQPVYRVTLADGKALTLTENHRVLTDEGWRTVRDAVALDGEGADARMTRRALFVANGAPVYQDRAWLYRTTLVHSPEHRAAIRRARSGSRSNFWRSGVSSERASIGAWTTSHAASVHAQFEYTCQSCGSLGGRLHAHHIVPVWADASKARDVGNLITVCDACHRRIHRTRASELAFGQAHAEQVGFAVDLPAPDRRGWKLTGHPVEVVAIEYVGLRQTYDLSVEGPWHNFVANGVVVHNSFNEFSLRYAKATDDFYVPDLEDVRTQVGKPGAYTFEPVEGELATHTRDELRKVYDIAYETYTALVEAGVARELARSVLPVGAYTEFYWTVNARSLMNFVSLRAAETAQREIRRYALAVETFLAREMPVTYAAFIGNERTAP